MAEFYETISGGGRSLSQLVSRLTSVRPIVLTTNAGVRAGFQAEGIDVVDIRMPAQALKDISTGFRRLSVYKQMAVIGALIGANLRLWRYLRDQNIAIVHCNSVYDFWSIWLAAKLRGLPVIFNLRATHPSDAMRAQWQLIIAGSTHVVVLSEEMKTYVFKRLWPGLRRLMHNRVHAIYTGMPLELFETHRLINSKDARQRLGLPQHKLLVGYVGEIGDRKGQRNFLEYVLPAIARKVNEIEVVFVGGDDGAAHESSILACKDVARRLGLDPHVRFVGSQDNTALWYRAFDFTILASRFEGLPRVFIESLLSARPVVAMEVASAREILERHQCGIVVPQGDHQLLASAAIEMAQNESYRTACSHRAVEVATNLFDIRRAAAAYDALYTATLAQAS